MQNRNKITVFFVIFFTASFFIFFLFKNSKLSFVQNLFSPIQSLTYNSYSSFINIFSSSKLKTLEDENLALRKQITDNDKLIADNKALLDQFQTQNPKSSNLLPANVIGAPNFIPGLSVPDSLIIDKGEQDGVKVGDAILFKDSLVGKIVNVSRSISEVLIVTNSNFSVTGKTMSTNASGVIKGQGGTEIILDNVLLSDSLNKDDFVLTKGDASANGLGVVPDIIVGKITSVSKNPSDLFQKAEIQTSIDFTKLNKVFVLLNQ